MNFWMSPVGRFHRDLFREVLIFTIGHEIDIRGDPDINGHHRQSLIDTFPSTSDPYKRQVTGIRPEWNFCRPSPATTVIGYPWKRSHSKNMENNFINNVRCRHAKLNYGSILK